MKSEGNNMEDVFDYASFSLLCILLYITALKTVYDPDASKFHRYGRIVLICFISVVVVSYLLYLIPRYL